MPRLVTILISQLNITDQEVIDWMEDPDNFDEVQTVNLWLRDNGSTPENVAFANLAFSQLMNDSELSFNALVIEYKINDNNLNPCSKTIMQQLKTLQTNDIAKIISRFGSPNSSYDWEVKNTTLTSGNVAETDRRNNTLPFDYVTDVDINYMNSATKISIARTLLHEMLHAYMISHIDDVNAGNSIDVRYFLPLWQHIRTTTAPGGSTEAAQHEFMALRFIPHLKSALKEYDGASQSDQYYEDLAWGALFNTGTFNHFHPTGSASRTRIINTNNAEDTNTIQGGISPKGNPC